MNRLLLTAGVAALLIYAGNVQAAPIAAGSELSLNGSDTFTASATAFDITFTNPANIGGTSGSFADAAAFGPVPPAINGVVQMIAQLTNTSTNFTLYTATVGAVTSTLTAGTITAFQFVPGAVPSLDVEGTGTLNLTGFGSVSGDYTLTSQGGATNVTFSETAVASAAEPGSLSLLGVAIGALGLTWFNGRRRKSPG